MRRPTTHWTRFLYHDYFGREDAASAHVHEPPVKPAVSSGKRVALRSPLRAAALLLAIYVTMYLAVGGALYVMRTPDADTRLAPAPDTAVASAPSD